VARRLTTTHFEQRWENSFGEIIDSRGSDYLGEVLGCDGVVEGEKIGMLKDTSARIQVERNETRRRHDTLWKE